MPDRKRPQREGLRASHWVRRLFIAPIHGTTRLLQVSRPRRLDVTGPFRGRQLSGVRGDRQESRVADRNGLHITA